MIRKICPLDGVSQKIHLVNILFDGTSSTSTNSGIFLEKSVSCCNPSSIKESPFTCFISVDHDDRGCIDPLPIFTRVTSPRCTSIKDCPTDSICGVPDSRSQLLRLTVRPSLAGIDDETVVVWSGSRREVWQEGRTFFLITQFKNFMCMIISVQVGNWLPRIWILPLWLPSLLDIFWQYVLVQPWFAI